MVWTGSGTVVGIPRGLHITNGIWLYVTKHITSLSQHEPNGEKTVFYAFCEC